MPETRNGRHEGEEWRRLGMDDMEERYAGD
jgi:hypothetical protein